VVGRLTRRLAGGLIRIRPVTGVLANQAAGAVAAGYLIGLPTFYTLFPPAAPEPNVVDQSATLRWGLLGVWAVIAVVTTVVAAAHSQAVERIVKRRERAPGRETIVQLGAIAVDLAIEAILRIDRSAPPDFEWTLFVYSGENDRLVPIYPAMRNQSDRRVFRRGQGAIGLAFETGDLIVATGDSVSDDSYGLTKAQRDEFREFRTVAAYPVKVGGFAIGALGAISRKEDEFFDSDEGTELIVKVAEVCGELLLVSRRGVD
jgi:hypothetical protein